MNYMDSPPLYIANCAALSTPRDQQRRSRLPVHSRCIDICAHDYLSNITWLYPRHRSTRQGQSWILKNSIILKLSQVSSMILIRISESISQPLQKSYVFQYHKKTCRIISVYVHLLQIVRYEALLRQFLQSVRNKGKTVATMKKQDCTASCSNFHN